MIYPFSGGNLHYTVEGTGQPFLIVHGFAVDHTMMKAVLEPFFEKQKTPRRRVYVDLPAMGQSDPLDGWDYADRTCRILSCFMEEVFPGEKYGIIAHSYGAYLSRKLLIDHPERIAGVFFAAPVIFPMKEDRSVAEFEKRLSLPGLEKADQKIYRAYAETAVAETRFGWECYRDTIYPVLKRRNRENLRFFQKQGYALSQDINTIEKKYPGPSLFLMGRQDHMTGYKDPLILRNRFPGSDFIILDGAGHYLFFEKYPLFCSLLAHWLDRLK